jgi:cytochrome c553
MERTLLTPSLAGQPDDYVQWQLVYFRRGGRKSEVMGPIAEALDNEQIRNLGAYYASLPAPKPAPSANPDEMAQDGEKVAVFHRCRSCHGEGFAGFGAAARLADQREDVLLKALRDVKTGARVASGIASMTDVVYGLNDDACRRWRTTWRPGPESAIGEWQNFPGFLEKYPVYFSA